jgi:hypothetical protein
MRVSKLAMTMPAGRPRRIAALAALALASLASAAWAQTAQSPAGGLGPAQVAPAQAAPVPPGPAPAATPAPQVQGAPGGFPAQPLPANRPGFIAEFGHWWDDARGKLDNLTKRPSDGAKDAANATESAVRNAAEATKDAMNAIVRLPATRVLELRARCELAPNGAPDCRQAAANACRGKGFSSGDPIDVRSSQNCPPAVLLSGRDPMPGECPTETVVLAAACH